MAKTKLAATFRVTLICCIYAGSGCANSKESEAVLRQRCVTKLWKTLEENYVYLELRPPFDQLRAANLEIAKAATTRREFLLTEARLLSALGDFHIQFPNLDAYLQNADKAPMTWACTSLDLAGGVFWIGLSRSQMEQVGTNGLPPDQPLYQLLAVEGLPVGGLAIQFLKAHPGEAVHIRVLAVDKHEYELLLRIPASLNMTDQARLEKKAEAESKLVTTEAIDNVSIIKINTLNDARVVAAFDKALDACLGANAIIIDLRNNEGGDAAFAQQILGRFLDSSRPYALLQCRLRGKSQGLEFPMWYSVALFSGGRELTYHGNVVVLINASTASVAELLAVGLKDTAKAVLVGERSIGAGAGIQSVTLPDGLVVQYSLFPFRRLDGRTFQYVGVIPDIEIPLDVQQVGRLGLPALRNHWFRCTAEAVKAAKALASGELFTESSPSGALHEPQMHKSGTH